MRILVGVGSGITSNSEADQEYAECLKKGSFLIFEPEEFFLLEGILLEEGNYFLLERHLDHLAASARYFGFSLLRDKVSSLLAELRTSHPAGRWKICLLVSRTGSIQVEKHRLEEDSPFWRVGLALRPIFSADRFLFHKTTHRQCYATLLQDYPEADDLVLWNERGELTESTRANLILVDREGAWTPPLDSGLLPGTFRQEMLDRGEIRERIIQKTDLRQVREVYLINSVRRKIPIRWLPGQPELLV